METAYDGRQVVGMDLHRRRSVLVRMTGDGRRLGTARFTNSPAELRAQIARAGKAPKVVLEATCGWYWAADTLAAAGAEVHLAHPLGVKAFAYRRVKDDVRDSADLADLLRMGRLPEAWIAPHEVRELRAAQIYAGAIGGGKDHPHAIRVLARAWIRVIYRCWLDGVPYDPARHGAARQLHASQQAA
jgi:transposase